VKALQELVTLSKYAGERFDLIQAGGGNTSVKTNDGELLIKASGFHLSELSVNKGIVTTDNQKVVRIIEKTYSANSTREEREQQASDLLKGAIISDNFRPSIETYLHALTYRYTLHSHPISVNAICCRQNWYEVLADQFPDAMYVEYDTPGIELALKCYKALLEYKSKFNSLPKVTFLQNHGLIISTDDLNETIELNETVIYKLSGQVSSELTNYQYTNSISRLINNSLDINNISYLSQDQIIIDLLKTNRDIFFTHPFCPDKMVYCGVSTLELADLEDTMQITDYIDKYNDLPRVLIWKNHVFMNAENVKKAMEMQEVFKFHLLSHVVFHNPANVNYLTNTEIDYLSNWEAEKYRKKL